MALVVGTVTVNPDGTHSGSGMAYAIFQQRIAALLAQPETAAYYADLDADAQLAFLLSNEKYYAPDSVAVATGVVNYLVANASVSITVKTSDVGLQRDPSTSIETFGPATPKVITGGTVA